MKWYYIDGPERRGPFTEDEWDELVRNGTIRPETLVWHEGADAKWRLHGEISQPAPVEAPPELPGDFAQRIADADYRVSLGESLSGAVHVLTNQTWMVIGAGLLMIMLTEMVS